MLCEYLVNAKLQKYIYNTKKMLIHIKTQFCNVFIIKPE